MGDRELEGGRAGVGEELLGRPHRGDQRRGRGHPAHLPAGEGEGLAARGDRQRALAHAGQRGQRDVGAVEDEVLVDLVGHRQQVVGAAQGGDLRQLVGREHLARRVVRRVEQHQLRLRGADGGGELVGVEGPVGRVQAHEARPRAGHGAAGGVGVVGRLEHDDLVAGLAQGEQGGGDGLGGADGDEHLGLGIEVEAVPGRAGARPRRGAAPGSRCPAGTGCAPPGWPPPRPRAARRARRCRGSPGPG